MALKGVIDQDHIQRNSFLLIIIGMPPMNIISVGSLEQELQNVTLPDRRQVTGGATTPLEVDVTTPEHHSVEQAAWEVWFRLAKEPVLVTSTTGILAYKRSGTLLKYSSTGEISMSRILRGVFPTKRSESDLDMENDGEDSRVTWTLSIDDVIPAPAGGTLEAFAL